VTVRTSYGVNAPPGPRTSLSCDLAGRWRASRAVAGGLPPNIVGRLLSGDEFPSAIVCRALNRRKSSPDDKIPLTVRGERLHMLAREAAVVGDQAAADPGLAPRRAILAESHGSARQRTGRRPLTRAPTALHEEPR
jgi:hypothetical protein